MQPSSIPGYPQAPGYPSSNWATFNGNNQVTGTTQSAGGFTYDQMGRVTYDGALTYLYDAEGRICAGREGSVMMGYVYDGDGNRIAKGNITSLSCDPTVNGFTATAYYVLDKDGRQVTELDGSGNFKHTNVWANGELLATITPTDTEFALSDWLGTTASGSAYRFCIPRLL